MSNNSSWGCPLTSSQGALQPFSVLLLRSLLAVQRPLLFLFNSFLVRVIWVILPCGWIMGQFPSGKTYILSQTMHSEESRKRHQLKKPCFRCSLFHWFITDSYDWLHLAFEHMLVPIAGCFTKITRRSSVFFFFQTSQQFVKSAFNMVFHCP